MPLLETLGTIGAVAGGLGSIFGSRGGSSTTTIDNSNPILLDALRRADMLSEQGIDPQILARMRARIANRGANQLSAQRGATASRLQRQGVPVQVQEQILRDLSVGHSGQINDAILDIDLGNEEAKRQALGQLIAGSQNLRKKIKQRGTPATGQGFANLFGTGIQSLLLSQMMGGDSGGSFFDAYPDADYQDPINYNNNGVYS